MAATPVHRAMEVPAAVVVAFGQSRMVLAVQRVAAAAGVPGAVLVVSVMAAEAVREKQIPEPPGRALKQVVTRAVVREGLGV